MKDKEGNMKQEVLFLNLSQRIPTISMPISSFCGHRLVLQTDAWDKTKYSLDFLANFSNTEQITEIMIDANVDSLQPLSLFSSLQSLAIGSKSKQELDFAVLRQLHSLSITGDFVFHNLHELSLTSLAVADTQTFPFHEINSGLQSLYLRHVGVNWEQIDNFCSLSYLELIRLPIQNLKGLAKITHLTECVIAYCRKLKDFSELQNCQSLRALELDHVKGVTTEDLSRLINLEKLILSSVGELPSIKFIELLPKLEFFSFVGTNILDGDLTPCLSLNYVGTLNKRHYNLKSDQLPYNNTSQNH